MRQTGHRHPMPLIPKELAQDDEARNHATAAIIQDRCELSGVNDTIGTVQPRNCVKQQKTQDQEPRPPREEIDRPTGTLCHSTQSLLAQDDEARPTCNYGIHPGKMITVRGPRPRRDSAGKELSQNSSKLRAQNQDHLSMT